MATAHLRYLQGSLQGLFKPKCTEFKLVVEGLKCVICMSIVNNRVVSPCCGNIVGCQQCVDTWLEGHTTCPHCNLPVEIESRFLLHGFGSVINILQSMAVDDVQPTLPTHSRRLHSIRPLSPVSIDSMDDFQ